MLLRTLDAGRMEAGVAFGRMPILAASVTNGGPEILMTGVFGRAHFQMGWFDDVDAVIDLAEARRRGVDVFRRPIWGGGTAFYDTDASAIVSFFLRHDRFPTLDAALEHVRPAMRSALNALGLHEASFEGSSDVRWQGRKLGTLITQSVLGTTVVGGFFNLRSPDLETYAAIARVPEEKFKDKIIKDQVAYICTPRDLVGRDITYEQFRDAVVDAAGSIAKLEPSEFTASEVEGAVGFAASVGADDYIARVSSERFRSEAAGPVGFANVKGKKLVRAGVELDPQGCIARALVAGDMHVSPPDAMDRVAAALAGADPSDEQDLLARIGPVFEAPDFEQPDLAAGVTPEDIARAVVLAVEQTGLFTSARRKD